jgi:hypothetical protein
VLPARVLELARVLVPELELVPVLVPGPELGLERVLEPARELELVPALGLVPHKPQTNHPPMPLPSPKLISVFYSLFSSSL